MLPVNDKFTPFINLGIGGTIGLYSSVNYTDENSYEGDYYQPAGSDSDKMRAQGGLYCDFGAGFRYKAFNFSFGLQHQALKLVNQYEEIGGSEGSYSEKTYYSTKTNAFYVKIGVNF